MDVIGREGVRNVAAAPTAWRIGALGSVTVAFVVFELAADGGTTTNPFTAGSLGVLAIACGAAQLCANRRSGLRGLCNDRG
jgi:hypothetical protein